MTQRDLDLIHDEEAFGLREPEVEQPPSLLAIIVAALAAAALIYMTWSGVLFG